MIKNLDHQTYHYPNKLLININFVTRHAQNVFSSMFIHIIEHVLYNNDVMHKT